MFKPNTRLVYLELPGSLSFEMQDTAAHREAAHDKGALVLMDNTWATRERATMMLALVHWRSWKPRSIGAGWFARMI